MLKQPFMIFMCTTGVLKREKVASLHSENLRGKAYGFLAGLEVIFWKTTFNLFSILNGE
jgi:hypothetical protein